MSEDRFAEIRSIAANCGYVNMSRGDEVRVMHSMHGYMKLPCGSDVLKDECAKYDKYLEDEISKLKSFKHGLSRFMKMFDPFVEEYNNYKEHIKD